MFLLIFSSTASNLSTSSSSIGGDGILVDLLETEVDSLKAQLEKTQNDLVRSIIIEQLLFVSGLIFKWKLTKNKINLKIDELHQFGNFKGAKILRAWPRLLEPIEKPVPDSHF